MIADKWLELLLLFEYHSLLKFSIESNFHFRDKIDYDKNEREREKERRGKNN